MREVTIVTGYRKTTIPKSAIRRAAKIAYAQINEAKEKENGKETAVKKKKKVD